MESKELRVKGIIAIKVEGEKRWGRAETQG
jgi:hypothetical protein